MEAQRPDPEMLLNVPQDSGEKKTGRLKIFFGYAGGVGKTYAMLEAARRAAEQGRDVAAGYIGPRTRPETMRLLEGIEVLKPLSLSYKGITLQEFDLNGALERNPQLILVDELAHTNAEGCRHRKRYQDVEELLRAGIDVYTTVNVQHLESLNDVVSSITGVTVNERVPDFMFDTASQVELVDIEPDDLILRLEAGKAYAGEQANNFFTRENLAALREIALRRMADRLGKAAQQEGKGPMPDAGEHILICLSSSPSNAKVIRTAARMAEAFHSGFTALFVETPHSKELDGDNRNRLRANLKLAEDLGARIATVYGEDVALQIAEYAKVSGVSKIVLGRSNQKKRLFGLGGGSLVDRLPHLAPNLDIYIIPDNQPPYRPKLNFPTELLHLSAKDFAKSLLVLFLCSAVGILFYEAGFGEANIITVYILGVLFTSIWTGGWLYGAFVSLLSVVLFNFFFTVPRFTLLAYDASYPVTFLVMLVASVLTSSLTMRVKNQARQAAQKAYRTEVLLEASQKLQKAEGVSEILLAAAEQMHKLIGRPVIFYTAEEDGSLSSPRIFTEGENLRDFISADEQAVAQWVFHNNKRAGATTNTLPSAKCLYLAVRGQSSVLAVAGIVMAGCPELDSFQKNLLISLLGECGIAMEKAILGAAKRKIELQAKQELLRANLLRAISHDLRTPLTSISGNAGILMENSGALDEEKKKSLYVSIYDDAMWLVGLVENLLSVTRMENGTISINLESELIEDVFQEALSHLDRKAKEHYIKTVLEDDLLMARMDARLIVQVVINLVNNAIKYTPPGSHIVLAARRVGEMVAVTVSDDGPGIPDEAKPRLFEMFYTADNVRGDGRRGLGLGLSLCKSIVNAHGGELTVKDHVPRGSEFTFTLSCAEVDAYE